MLRHLLLLGLLSFVQAATLAQPAPVVYQTSPIPVKITQDGTRCQLLRGGQPYYVQGAGGSRYLDRLAAYGGNSLRTWSSRNGQAVLDSAQYYGLTVLLGLEMGRQRQGFDYDDSAAVGRQLAQLKTQVLAYRNHPALLAWGIGNELNLNYTNPRVWSAVNAIATMIHSLDPNHPVRTVLAGVNKDVITQLHQQCPALDFLGINTYGGLASLPKIIAAAGWHGPYMVTEWGPTGHWEGLRTSWQAPIEETSSEKAAVYKSRYETAIETDRPHCLGSYVFLWGQKQERTPTWYGLFTESGEETEVLDVLQYLWRGQWPHNQAPHLYSLQLAGQKAGQSVRLQAGGRYPVSAVVVDPDQDPLTYCWELLPEPTQVGEGGDYEARPQRVATAFTGSTRKGQTIMTAPMRAGAYRLFVYASDSHNKVATANIPCYLFD